MSSKTPPRPGELGYPGKARQRRNRAIPDRSSTPNSHWSENDQEVRAMTLPRLGELGYDQVRNLKDENTELHDKLAQATELLREVPELTIGSHDAWRDRVDLFLCGEVR